MIKNGLASEADIKALEAEVAAEVDDCVEFADASPKPVSVCQPSASQPASQPAGQQASQQAASRWAWVVVGHGRNVRRVPCVWCELGWVGCARPPRAARCSSAVPAKCVPVPPSPLSACCRT